MSTQRYAVMLPTPHGGRISCHTYLTDEERDHYRASGYEVDRVISVVPGAVVDAGFAPVWVFFQSIFNFDFKHYWKRGA